MVDEADRDEAGTAFGPRVAHLVGLNGRGMAGLAQVLTQGGMIVSGSDDDVDGPELDGLRRLGIRVHQGHPPLRSKAAPHLLVYDMGQGREHPERLAALRDGIAQSSRGEILGRLIAGKLAVALSGRGGGLTGAMLAWVLTCAGLDPTVVLTTLSPQLGGRGRLGSGPAAVIETRGLPEEIEELSPWLAMMMAPSPDPQPGKDWRSLIETAAEVTRGGVFVAGDVDLHGLRVSSKSNIEQIGLKRGADWWGADLREDRGRYRFRAFYRGNFVTEVRLRMPGLGPVLCALSALAAGGRYDVPASSMREALEEFTGVSRGFESRGSYRGVTLVDDEAQDPSSVGETLSVGRMMYGRRRLWAVLGPGCNSNERAETFVDPLSQADRVLVVGVGGHEASPGPWESAIRSLDERGVSAVKVADRDEAVDRLDRQLEPGDVLITLGSGQVGTIADAFLGRLPRDRQAG